MRAISGLPVTRQGGYKPLNEGVSRSEAWERLGAWQAHHPEREFSMRRMTNIGPELAGLAERASGEGDDAGRSA